MEKGKLVEGIGNEIGNNGKCVVCDALVSKATGFGGSKESWRGLEIAEKAFMIRILLDVPREEVGDKYLLPKEATLETCEGCSETVKMAKKIFEGILEAAETLKGIQKEMVGKVRKIIADNGKKVQERDNGEDVMQKCRGFVKTNCYDDASNCLGGLFVPTLVEILPVLVKEEYQDVHDEDTDYDDESTSVFENNQLSHTSSLLTSESEDEDRESRASDGEDIPKKVQTSDSEEDPLTDGSESEMEVEDDQERSSNQEIKKKTTKGKALRRSAQNKSDKSTPIIEDRLKDKSIDIGEENKRFQCSKCKKYFLHQKSLKNHGRKIHGDKTSSKHPCPIPGCPHGCKNQQYLDLHLANHYNYKCPYCEMGFYSPAVLRTHQETAHPEKHSKVSKVECPVCQELYKDVCGVRKHIVRHHPTEKALIKDIKPLSFPCPWPGCGKVLRRHATLQDHLSQHKGEPQYKCDHCEQAFYRHNQKVDHMEREHGPGDPIECKICCFQATSNYAMKRHKAVAHSDKARRYHFYGKKEKMANKSQKDSQNLVCQTCHKVFSTKGSLSLHIRTVHEKEYLKICEFCSKGFNCESLLRNHQIVEHGVGGSTDEVKVPRYYSTPDFTCPVKGCRAYFWGDKNKEKRLEKHMKQYHGEDGKSLAYICKFCGRAFGRKARLDHHELLHVNKETKPFKCKLCGKGFATPVYLRTHEKEFHKLPLKFTKQRRWKKKREGVALGGQVQPGSSGTAT